MWEGERTWEAGEGGETVIGILFKSRVSRALFLLLLVLCFFYVSRIFCIFLCLRFGNERTYEEATADQDHFEMFSLLLLVLLYFVIFSLNRRRRIKHTIKESTNKQNENERGTKKKL